MRKEGGVVGGQVPSYTNTPGRNGGQALRRPPDVQKVSYGLSDGVALGGEKESPGGT